MEAQEIPEQPRDRRGQLLLAAIAALVVFIALVSLRDRSNLPKAGSDAPVLELALLDGTVVDSASWHGKVVVLDFWATWCPPCVKSMPVVQKVGADLAASGVVTIAVNRDDGPSREKLVRHFLRRQGLEDLVVALDDGHAAGAYSVTALPTLVVIGRDGKVAATHLGAVSEELLRSLIAPALAAGGDAS